MALTLASAFAVRQQCNLENLDPLVAEQLRAFFHTHAQRGDHDLQFVPISGLDSAPQRVADISCLVYAIVLYPPGVQEVVSYLLIADTASSPTYLVVTYVFEGQAEGMIWPKGKQFFGSVDVTQIRMDDELPTPTAAVSGFVILGPM